SAELGGEIQGLAEAEKVVGLIVEADESAREAADPAVEADGLLPFFPHLQGDIDRALLRAALQIHVLVLLDDLEVVELIDPQNAELPEAVVEEVALVEQQLAADHLVARGGVAHKFDAADAVGLPQIELQGQVHHLGSLVHVRLRHRSEIDVAEISEEVLILLEGLAHLLGREDVSLFQGKGVLEVFGLENQLGVVRVRAANDEPAHAEAVALINFDGDVGGLAVMAANSRNGERDTAFVHVHGFELGLFDRHGEVAVVLVQGPDAEFEVLFQFSLVERLVCHLKVEGANRKAIGAVIAHRADQLAVGKGLVADEGDLADLDLGPLLDQKREFHGVRSGDARKLGRDRGVLPAVFGEQLLDDDFGAADLGGIEGTLHRQSELALLVAIQDVGFGNGTVALVVDVPDDGTLFDVEDQDHGVGLLCAGLDFQPDVLEILGVP